MDRRIGTASKLLVATGALVLAGTALASAAWKEPRTGVTVLKVAYEANQLVVQLKTTPGATVSVVSPAVSRKANSKGLVDIRAGVNPSVCTLQIRRGTATSGNIWISGCGLRGLPGLVMKGDWKQETQFAANDAVLRNGSTYFAKRANKGKDPEQNPLDWGLVAAKGVGEAGPKGDKGDKGDPGVRLITNPQAVTTFQPGDMVVVTGSSYVATVQTNKMPPDAAWTLVAKAGTDGKDGANGIGNLRYRGVLSEVLDDIPLGGETIKRDDMVTNWGSVWIAKKDNPVGDPGNPNLPPQADWGIFNARGVRGPEGPQGPQGVPGVANATIRGEWQSGNIAEPFTDIYTYAGSAWYAIAPTLGTEEPGGPKWAKLVSKGDKGDTGPQGPGGVLQTVGIVQKESKPQTLNSGGQYTFVGPQALLTIGQNQRISASISASIDDGAGAAANVPIRVAVCRQKLNSAEIAPLNGSDADQAFAIPASFGTAVVIGTAAIAEAGQYNIGFCAKHPTLANVSFQIDGISGQVTVTAN